MTNSKATIVFINNMDKFFDIFNSSDVLLITKFLMMVLYNQLIINAIIELFENMKVVYNVRRTDMTERMNSINVQFISICGLQML